MKFQTNALLLFCIMLCNGVAFGAQAVTDSEPSVKREIVLWQAVKNKTDTFSASLAPEYAGVYSDGVHSRDTEIEAVRQQNLHSFELEDVSTRRLDDQTQLLTYKVTIQAELAGADISGSYWATSLWRLVKGKWLLRAHTEAKVQ